MSPFKVTILGCGTSTGVPTIGCHCFVCSSTNPKNKRLRSSILITRLRDGKNLVVDTTPDFRMQMLRERVDRLDAVLYTHTHADHCHGFDDLRAFYFHTHQPVPCYIAPDHLPDLKARFSYAFESTGYDGHTPQVDLIELKENFSIWDDFEIEVVRLQHGHVKTAGFRFGSFAYITDFKVIPEEVFTLWAGKVKTMVASGLRFKSHNTHSLIPETIEVFRRLQVERGIITHMAHEVEFERDSKDLPPGVELGFDGLSFEVP